MAGPTLEIFRMAIYVFIPVASFYYFNLPEFYEKNVKSRLVCSNPILNVHPPHCNPDRVLPRPRQR